MDDLLQELQSKVKQLDVSVRQLRRSGTEYASAERDYKILLRAECLNMREDGLPVGLIDKTCYGVQSVADARFRRDVAQAVYEANKEAINTIKLQLRLIEAQIEREWHSEN